MLIIDIPGFKKLKVQHLVLDYNGTLACDGELLNGVEHALGKLAPELDIHVITADTFGSVTSQLDQLPCTLRIIPKQHQDQAKADYISTLGATHVVAIGNGRNDHKMLQDAALGIAIIQQEGAAAQTLQAADVIVKTITDAFDLLLEPSRLIATLRN